MTPRRRWFHFSLKSLLVMHAVLVGFVFGMAIPRHYGPSPDKTVITAWGWPFVYRWDFNPDNDSGLEEDWASESLLKGFDEAYARDQSELHGEWNDGEWKLYWPMSVPRLVADIVIAIACIAVTGLASEHLLFRRKRDSGASEK